MTQGRRGGRNNSKRGPEAMIQALILEWLNASGIWCMRMQSGRLMGAAGYPVRFGVPGCADILCTPQGRIQWLEVKAAKGVFSEEQKAFKEWVERHGHSYAVVRSLDEVIEVLNV